MLSFGRKNGGIPTIVQSSPNDEGIKTNESLKIDKRDLRSLLVQVHSFLQKEDIQASQIDQDDIKVLQDMDPDKDKSPWRLKVSNWLHSTPVTIAVVSLVIFDCFLVMGELFLDFRSYYKTSSQCCDSVNSALPHDHWSGRHKRASGGNKSPKEVTLKTYNSTLHIPDRCDPHAHHIEIEIAHILHYLSITILAIFLIEICVRLIAMGFKPFFKSKVEVIDAVVVITAFAIDVAALFASEESVMGFLSITLFWRVVRIINTVLASYKRHMKLKYELQRMVRKKMEKKNEEMGEKIKFLEKEIEMLKDLATAKGATELEVKKCQPVREAKIKKGINNAVSSMAGMMSGIVSMGMMGGGLQNGAANSKSCASNLLTPPKTNGKKSPSLSIRSNVSTVSKKAKPPKSPAVSIKSNGTAKCKQYGSDCKDPEEGVTFVASEKVRGAEES